MTPQQIAGLGPALTEFLRSFRACFGERRLLTHFATYCRGLLSDLPRKTVEPVALAAGTTVRALQLFLAQRDWDHRRLRDLLQQRIAAQHAPAPGTAPPGLGVTIGLIDETSAVKKGDQTPGVQRQYCGAVGKVENCIVSVHLGYCRPGGDEAGGDFIALLDADLFLPQSWSDDRPRCQAANIPDDLVYRPKTLIALDQVRRALGNGLHFDFLVFDEGYGKDPSFLLGLGTLGQTWIGEVPKNFRCWPTRPQYHSWRKEFASKEVRNVVRWSKAFIYQEWRSFLIPRQTTEPATWDVKGAQVYLADPHSHRPTDRSFWLIVAWNRVTGEYKYFLSNAPPTTDLLLLLRVAFRRAQVEHLFRAVKQHVGFTHFEGRSYLGLMRHLILCQLLLLFLAEQTRDLNAQAPPPERPAEPPPQASEAPAPPAPPAAQPLEAPLATSPPDPARRRGEKDTGPSATLGTAG